MRTPSSELWFTLELNWQRGLAAICFVLALGTLAFAFVIRPAVSGYVGRQVGERIGQEVAAELEQAVRNGLLTPGQGGQRASGGQGGAPATAQGVPAAAPAQLPGDPGQSAAQAASPGRPRAAAPALGQASAGVAQTPGEATSGAMTGQLRSPAQEGGEPAQAPMPGDEIEVAGAAPPAPAVAPPATAIATPISAPQSERSLEQIVEELPAGEITVSEEKLNAKIGPRVAAMAPIEGAEVRFVPGVIQVTLKVYGQTSIATAGLAAGGGGVAVQQPRIDGPLGLLVAPDALVRPIEEELNGILELAGREVRAVRIEQGQIVVTLN